jgi:hypothetical protein
MNQKEETDMVTKRSIFVLFGILVISAWVFGSAIQAGAETMNYKYYTYVTKSVNDPVGDVDGHTVGHEVRKSFYVFENGEVATSNGVVTGDLIKFSGPFMQYLTLNFPDGSTIIWKVQGTFGGASASMKSEILKGTGRFEGIKGTQVSKGKYLPVEEGEAGPKGYGEGAMTYTLPSK